MSEHGIWTYARSVERMKAWITAQDRSAEMLAELAEVRDRLSSRYRRADGTRGSSDGTQGSHDGTRDASDGTLFPVPSSTSAVPSWSEYCEAVGVTKRTANRWLSEDVVYEIVPTQKTIDAVEASGDAGVLVQYVKCPHCSEGQWVVIASEGLTEEEITMGLRGETHGTTAMGC